MVISNQSENLFFSILSLFFPNSSSVISSSLSLQSKILTLPSCAFIEAVVDFVKSTSKVITGFATMAPVPPPLQKFVKKFVKQKLSAVHDFSLWRGGTSRCS